MSEAEHCFLYMTTQNKDEAHKLAKGLVEQRLIACANVLDGMSSIYWWNDEIQEDSECVLIAKTRARHVSAVTEYVRAHHSYECPCVVAFPIVGGNPAFLSWIGEQTRASD